MRSHYTLPRLYLDEPLNGQITLSPEHARYLGTVLRKRTGDYVRLFNARDGEWSAVITETGKRTMTVRVETSLRAPMTTLDIRLLFSPLRKHRTATVLEKATELGVRVIQPVITARTQFPKLNLDRAKAQVIEAAEQTERLDLPELHAPIPLVEALSERPILFADEAGHAEDLFTVLQSASLPLDVLIGPEGGFAEDERATLRDLPNVIPISLGPRILRADTAAISVLTLVQATCGDWPQT